MTSQQNGNMEDLYDDALKLIDEQQSCINKQRELIELHEKLEDELKRHISLLEEELGLFKNCYTCKHLDVYGFEEPCMSCTRCMINHCTNDQSDKWEPKE